MQLTDRHGPSRREGPPGRMSASATRKLTAVFRALADVEDAGVLAKLSPQSLTASELAAVETWTRDKAAKKLSNLRRDGLLNSKQDGRTVRYRLKVAPLVAAAAWAGRLADAVGSAAAKSTPNNKREVAAALANAGRISLLEQIISAGRSGQSELVLACRIPQGRASKGLKRLVVAGLLTALRIEGGVFYEVDLRALGRLVCWLDQTAGRAQAQASSDPRAGVAPEPSR